MKKILRLPTTLVLFVLVGQSFNASAQTVTNLYSFFGRFTDGGDPESSLVQGADGNLYGTALGGFARFGSNDNGCVFRISLSGGFTNLHSFQYSDGARPGAGLVQGSDGNFYGTTTVGGNTNVNHGIGFGTVFRMTPSGTLSSLYSFTGAPDGAFPFAALVQGKDGDFYGTTSEGGITTNGQFGYGTIFRISPSGNYTNLYSFKNYPNDGSDPLALVQGSDGNLYGTTEGGGANHDGTVFRISPTGDYTNLHSFSNSPDDGMVPGAGLVQGSDGNFYGTTQNGGNNRSPQAPNGVGTVFRISLNGDYTNLYAFTGPPDGEAPSGSLIQGSDGNLYGVMENGGAFNNGTLFRINLNGIYSNLYSFGGFPRDGSQPNAALVQGIDGNFYGMTTFGGINNSGTVYRLSVPLSPPPYPINHITGVQMSGTNIVFNIPSIASETYQLQFSSSMNPTNWVNVPGVSVTNSIGALLTFTNFGGAIGPQGFYRFDITP
jgi:uncharacterized repeat protein (TIGR03803 family)